MNNETFNLFISRYEIIKRFFSLFDFNEDDPSESFGFQCKVIGDDLASRNVIGVTHEAIQTYFDEEEKSFLIAFLVKSQYADFKICRDNKDGSIGNRYSLTNFKLIHLLTYLLS